MELIDTSLSAPRTAGVSDRRAEWSLAYLRHAPLALGLRELNRILALQTVFGLPSFLSQRPLLDVGCGDGFWWTLLTDNRQGIYGVDISQKELDQAASRIEVRNVDISSQVPFEKTKFVNIIGNCSLEHVPDIDGALSNLNQSAEVGARLVLFVPTPHWSFQGRTQKFLLRHFPRIAMTLSGAMNGFFQHWHLYDIKVWRAILERNHWKVVEAHGLGNAQAEFLFRLFLPLSFMGFVVKKLFGVYPNRILAGLPSVFFAPGQRLMMRALNNPVSPADSRSAYEYMIVAEKSVRTEP